MYVCKWKRQQSPELFLELGGRGFRLRSCTWGDGRHLQLHRAVVLLRPTCLSLRFFQLFMENTYEHK
uniref:Uncharacterized protein n=1 Tax=Cucumis sativus TaxID=3659 RepID=A0A0A0KNC6_CUCSA